MLVIYYVGEFFLNGRGPIPLLKIKYVYTSILRIYLIFIIYKDHVFLHHVFVFTSAVLVILRKLLPTELYSFYIPGTWYLVSKLIATTSINQQLLSPLL